MRRLLCKNAYAIKYTENKHAKVQITNNKSQKRCTISQIYFGKELYMFRTDLLSIIRSLSTVYTAKGICHASYVDCPLARSGS